MKIDRLLGILTILLRYQKVTAPELAKRFEVSTRTICRDIEDLCKAGIPVITLQGVKGGIYIDERFKLEKNLLTQEELRLMIAGIRSIGSVTAQNSTENLLDKLSHQQDNPASLREHILIDLSSHYKSSLTDKIQLLKAALNEQKMVSFTYYSRHGHHSYSVEPYYIVFRWTDWYLFAYSQNAGDFRLFKLNRLWELACQGQTFHPRGIPKEKQDFDQYFTDHIPVVIRFSQQVCYRLVEEYGPASFTLEDSGTLLFKRGFTSREYLLSWVSSFGSLAEVLEPEDIRRELHTQALRILEYYDET